MASFKSNPTYFSLLGVLGLAVAAAGWGIYDRHSAAEKGAAQLAQKQRELTSMQSVDPAPSEANKAAIEADLRRTQEALATMREELKGRGPLAESMRNSNVPTQPTEAFFNLETFVERTRQKAQVAEVKVKPDERFGFYTYVRTGPERELIAQVFRQRQVIEYLIDALFDSRPSELVSLHRERPLTKTQQPVGGRPSSVQSSAAANAQGTTDFFDIDPRISARVPGFVGATAFRLTFISETASLRTFLNKLATFELPLVVRGVEVEPVAKAQRAAPVAQANTLSSIFGTATPAVSAEPIKPKPLVEKIFSKFTVTVELIDLVDASATEATPTN